MPASTSFITTPQRRRQDAVGPEAFDYCREVAAMLERPLGEVLDALRRDTCERREEWNQLVRDYETARYFALNDNVEIDPPLPDKSPVIERGFLVAALVLVGLAAAFVTVQVMGWQGH